MRNGHRPGREQACRIVGKACAMTYYRGGNSANGPVGDEGRVGAWGGGNRRNNRGEACDGSWSLNLAVGDLGDGVKACFCGRRT